MLLRQCVPLPARCCMVCLAAPLAPAAAQTKPTTKPWNYGVIEPKGDAGFSLMVSQRGFAEKRGLNVKIVPLANGTLAHKALLAGEIDAIEIKSGLGDPCRLCAAPISRSSAATGRACCTG